MKVNEIFYSLQGEGRLVGVPSVFVRLAGCPLRCKWCDTKYAWQQDSSEQLSVNEIIDKIKSYNCPNVVITGGEPLTNPEIEQLINAVRTVSKHITVETAGIKYIADLPVDLVSISPKLSNSTPEDTEVAAIHEKERININALTDLLKSYKCQLKFVVESKADIDEIKALLNDCGENDAEIMLMPQAVDRGQYLEKSKEVAEICKQTGYSFSPRLHILLWGGRRGV